MSLTKLFGSFPNAPTGLSTVNDTDTAITLSWTPSDVLAYTEVYRDSVLIATVAPGVTSYQSTSLTAATNYTFLVRHKRNGVVGPNSSAVVGRPVVSATGGSITTSGGFNYHVFTADATFTMLNTGHIDYWGVGCGGDGGAGVVADDYSLGGGGGASGNIFLASGTLEPANPYPVVIGTRINGGTTTYRAESAARGNSGTAADDALGRGGNGGDNASASGGIGDPAGVHNNGGGGGGAGLAGGGAAGNLFGGAGGGGYAVPFVGTVGTGGNGGRVTGNGENGATYGDGGAGAWTGSVGLGHSGIFVVRYPI
jgi:hypothetical protein